MKLAKAVAIAGLALILLGVLLAFIPMTQERWESRSEVLTEGKDISVIGSREYSVTLTYLFLREPENYRDIEVKGYVEGSGPYDLTVGQYVRASNVTRYEFAFSPRAEEVKRGIEMVIRSRATKRVEEDFIVTTVTLYSFSENNWWFAVPLFAPRARVPVRITGRAEEATGRAINLYLLDKENFERWRAGLPFEAYFAGKGLPSYTVDITIPPEKIDKEVYYVVERVGKAGFDAPELKCYINLKKAYEAPEDITVSYRVEMTWEEVTYAHVLGGLFVGALLFGLGFLLLIAAALLKIILR